MPYVTNEEVKEIRNNFKTLFPEYKFSIRKENHSSVNVHVLSGPHDFGETYFQVNHFYVDRHYEGETRDILSRMVAIGTVDIRTVSHDGDYGAIPNFYFNLRIGRWDRPYQVIKK